MKANEEVDESPEDDLETVEAVIAKPPRSDEASKPPAILKARPKVLEMTIAQRLLRDEWFAYLRTQPEGFVYSKKGGLENRMSRVLGLTPHAALELSRVLVSRASMPRLALNKTIYAMALPSQDAYAAMRRKVESEDQEKPGVAPPSPKRSENAQLGTIIRPKKPGSS